MLRLFISVDLPPKFESEIEELQSRLEETRADLKPVDPSQAHLTLKFLGDVPQSRTEEAKEIIDEVSEKHSRFTARLKGTGVFPGRDYISVIWAGFDKGNEEFKRIHEDIEERVVEKDLAEEEDHEFTSHATIARMNSGRGKEEVLKFLDETEDIELGEFEVANIRLKESTLKSKGPVYETIHEAELSD